MLFVFAARGRATPFLDAGERIVVVNTFEIFRFDAIPEDARVGAQAHRNGADHILLGMFDFEIAEDVGIANKVLAAVKRERPWRS